LYACDISTTTGVAQLLTKLLEATRFSLLAQEQFKRRQERSTPAARPPAGLPAALPLPQAPAPAPSSAGQGSGGPGSAPSPAMVPGKGGTPSSSTNCVWHMAEQVKLQSAGTTLKPPVRLQCGRHPCAHKHVNITNMDKGAVAQLLKNTPTFLKQLGEKVLEKVK
jgi:hypothetical protein